MAKKKSYKSPQRKQYEHELNLLKRRQKEWVKTKHYIVSDIKEKKSKESYSEAAERLHNIRLSSFTKEQKEEYSKNYEIKYEAGEITTDEKYDKPYTPPTENDFYDNYDNYDEYWWEDTENKPVQEEQEYSADIEELIEEIVSTSDVQGGRDNVRDTLRNLLDNARSQMGDKEFYKFLKDSNALKDLQDAANEAIFKYIKKGEDYDSAINSLLSRFATILNRNRPLSDEQSYTLETYGTIDYDYDE